MASSGTVNKYLRRVLGEHSAEFLRESTMEHYFDRRFFRYYADRIYVVTVFSSGGYRGEPWKSFMASIGIYYQNYPGYAPAPLDPTGREVPHPAQIRLSFPLTPRLDQRDVAESLGAPSLAGITDVWLVLPKEDNLLCVLRDIAGAVRDEGIPLASRAPYQRAEMIRKHESP